jgi:hypothetical protein
MAVRTWQPLKTQYCGRADEEVSLEAEMVFPSETLPDQPARVLAHRCSQAMACNQFNQAACVWAGTNPTYDPFAERS